MSDPLIRTRILVGDEPLERHAARGDVTGAFLQSQRAGPRRGRPVLPIGRRFSPP